jgi:hypothetical protein
VARPLAPARRAQLSSNTKMKLRRKILLLQQQPYANAETSAWVARVVAAGSTVSPASAAAHDAFITAAKSGGFWSLLSRFNTYGANTLAGALVPLVNTVGNATDTNHNFVSGDFSLAVGLTGDGATKYLDTGALPSSFATTTSLHLAACTSTNAGNYNGFLMGSEDVGNTNRLEFIENSGGPTFSFYTSATFYGSSYNTSAPGFYIGSRTGITTSGLYRNAVSKATSSGTGNSPSSLHSIYVHAANVAGSVTSPVRDIFQSYSCGSGLTSTQATAYYNALNTLMTALGRTIPA